MSEHFINKCSCGAVISQCRCPGVKTETVIQNGCAACQSQVSEAKQVTQCDSCKMGVSTKKAPKESPPNPAIKAVLNDGLGNAKDYHFCDEECLRQFLNTRRKKALGSYIETDGFSLVVDATPFLPTKS